MNDVCPPAGGGVHLWLLSEANRCRLRGLSPDTATAVLRETTATCGRAVPAREIQDAVRAAFASTWTPGGRTAQAPPSPPKWPQVNAAAVRRIISEGPGLADLWEASPNRIEDNANHAEEILPRLFLAGSLLCCGKSQSDFDTRPQEEWRGHFAELQFIVPSPMSAVTGRTKDGKVSKHTLANTGPRRFLVCEFDQGTVDEQAALLMHLPNPPQRRPPRRHSPGLSTSPRRFTTSS